MALTIDSHAVLRALAEHPEAFPAIQPDLEELARKLLGKQLKAKSTDATLFKQIYSVTGATTMATMLDGFAANDVSALVKKIDPHSAYAGPTGDLHAVRAHIVDLATGRVQPATKPEKAAKAPKAVKPSKGVPPKIGGILESKVHSGGRARTPTKRKV